MTIYDNGASPAVAEGCESLVVCAHGCGGDSWGA